MIEKLGKYEIMEKIGVGGFGTVYKGRDPFIKRTVAIKTCQSEEEEIKKRFFREAELSGNLHHRHITTIYDFGVENGVPYIVQEYLTGEDLDRKIKRSESVPIERKLEILIDICDGLAYAHAAGVIHRDIKPANIRILEDGTVKIMDFGIAKSFQSESNLTQTGITLGTAAYLAPEQIRGEPVDPRTDIFSLGVLAYELFAYQKPFKGEHISTVLFKILNEKPESLSHFSPDIPPSLEMAIERTLAKAQADRYDSVPMFRRDLALILAQITGQPADAAPGAPRDSTAVTTIARFAGGPGGPEVTPPSGALARSPSPLETTPTPSSGAVSRNVSLELVDFRDPTAPARNESTSSVPHFVAAEPRGAFSPVVIVLAILILGGGGAFWYFRMRTPATSPPAVPAPAASVSAPPPAPAPPLSHETHPAATAAAAPPRPAPAPSTPVETEKPKEPAKPKKIAVKFSSTPVSDLYIDGKSIGPTVPVKSVTLEEGTHRIRFEMEDGTVFEQQAEVGPKGATTIFHTFPVGSILVTASPEWRGAKVLVDSKPRGVLPLSGVLLATPGPHDIEIVRDGIPPVIKNIKVVQGERQEIHIAPPDKAP